MDQKNEESFSLEENLRQRAYYEKYYEDLASHAAQMDKIGQHEVAELDREEMKNASSILGDLVREKQAYDDQKDLSTSQETTLPQEQAAQQASQAAITPETTNEKAQSNDYEIDDIPEEDRIKVDKSHLSQEVRDAEARADQQLAADEAAMDEKIKAFEAEIDQNEGMDSGAEIEQEAYQQAMESGEVSATDGADETIQTEQNQSYDYGIGF